MGNTPQFNLLRIKDPVHVGERKNDHSWVFRRILYFPSPLTDREMVMRCLWDKVRPFLSLLLLVG